MLLQAAGCTALTGLASRCVVLTTKDLGGESQYKCQGEVSAWYSTSIREPQETWWCSSGVRAAVSSELVTWFQAVWSRTASHSTREDMGVITKSMGVTHY